MRDSVIATLPLTISKRNLAPACFFGLLTVAFLSPLYWTTLTGRPYLVDIGPWEGAVAALLVGWGAWHAARGKVVKVTTGGVSYLVSGKVRFDLEWEDVRGIASCADDWEKFTEFDKKVLKLAGRSRRKSSNIRITDRGGKEQEIDGLSMPDKTLKLVFRTMADHVRTCHPTIEVDDRGQWSSEVTSAEHIQ